jgi:large subunit ribosomal protein L27
VGFGHNGSLYALKHGRVVVSCEKVDLNLDHPWVERFFAGREQQTIYKKYFNVIADKQPQRFRLVDEN